MEAYSSTPFKIWNVNEIKLFSAILKHKFLLLAMLKLALKAKPFISISNIAGFFYIKYRVLYKMLPYFYS